MTSLKPKVSHEKPKFWWIIQFFWGADFNKIGAFTFGDTIYSARPISPSLMAHESTHVRQMRGSKVYGVWCLIRYYFSKSYRFKCELEALRAQVKAGGSLEVAALNLSSPFYGFGISRLEATKLLCE